MGERSEQGGEWSEQWGGELFPSLSRTKERGERAGGVGIGQMGGGEGDKVGLVRTAWFGQ